MENLIALVGLLFFLMLVLSAAVEALLEVARGVLESIGVKVFAGTVSLEDALLMASEFVASNDPVKLRMEALKTATAQLQMFASDLKSRVKDASEVLTAATTPELRNAVETEINTISAKIRQRLEKSERLRIFCLRILSALIGCGLVWASDFHVLRMLSESPEGKVYLAQLTGLSHPVTNIVIGGLAAAGGSSFWHDKLDKVRNLKAALTAVKTVKPPTR